MVHGLLNRQYIEKMNAEERKRTRTREYKMMVKRNGRPSIEIDQLSAPLVHNLGKTQHTGKEKDMETRLVNHVGGRCSIDDQLIRRTGVAALELGHFGRWSQAGGVAQENIRAGWGHDALAITGSPLIDLTFKLKCPAGVAVRRKIGQEPIRTVVLKVGRVRRVDPLVLDRILFDGFLKGDHVTELDADFF